MKLLNGNDTVRQRNSDSCTVLACGCAHSDTRWLQMCDPHGTEESTLHAQAAADYRAGALAREFT